ncbi:MAG: carbohydrate kinase family protein [Spirochaetales bacterium]
MSLTIHGAGCCLMDFLYTGADFTAPAFTELASRSPGDGGLNIGGLVFAEHLASFADQPIAQLIESLAAGKDPDAQNVGGPAIVSLIHTAQVVPEATVRFFGLLGNDEAGATIARTIDETPVDSTSIARAGGATPATHVFSDPSFNGEGERLFVNQLGVANNEQSGQLPDRFFEADIVQFGGTALVPPLHSRLPEYLRRAKASGAFTVVNTVYDFMAESRKPGSRWTLGSDESYPSTDLIIADLEEARRLTGCETAENAVQWFLNRGVGAAIVTCGADPVWFASASSGSQPISMPVYAQFRIQNQEACAGGDTTGCGDNFCGGVVAEIAKDTESFSIADAVDNGIAAGALCLTYVGGTLIEEAPGQKRRKVESVQKAYQKQLG